ncbi:MAG: MFS transporter [Gammaproteobacteria bacterium]|nr:MFS transporter [Gammaproteobacteria bacterium]MDH3447939.1 MFS transporter [Gammaproteobacteria bacterium]
MKDRPILLLAVAQTLIWACIYYSFPALLLHWEQALGWSRADLTGAITLAVFVSAFCSPLYGRLIDAGRGALMMTSASVIGGCCMILLTQIEYRWQFYLVWGVIGICMSGSLYEPCFALITRARGEHARRSIILVTLVAGFAGTVSFPVAHSLASTFGWRGAVLFFGATAIFVVAPMMWLGANAVEQAGAHRHRANPQLSIAGQRYLRSPVFWCLALGFGLGAVMHGVTLHHLLPILSERDIHPEVAVVAISFIGPMQVAGRLAMMAAERHVSNHGIAVTCFVLMAMSILFLIGAGKTPALLVGFVILFGGAYGMVSIIRPVIARELLGERQFGAKSGALALVYLAGSASAPFLGSLGWSWGGYDLVLPGLVLIAVSGLGLYLVAQKTAGAT